MNWEIETIGWAIEERKVIRADQRFDEKNNERKGK